MSRLKTAHWSPSPHRTKRLAITVEDRYIYSTLHATHRGRTVFWRFLSQALWSDRASGLTAIYIQDHKVRRESSFRVGTHHFSALAMCSWASFIFWAAMLWKDCCRKMPLISRNGYEGFFTAMFGLPGTPPLLWRHRMSQAMGAAEGQTTNQFSIVFKNVIPQKFFLTKYKKLLSN